MKLKCKLMKADEPTANGRIYTKEALQKAINKFNDKEETKRLGTFGYYETELPLDKISHKINYLQLDYDGNIIADIEFLPTEGGKILSNLNKKFLTLLPVFIGKVDEYGKVDIDDITTVHVTNYDIKE
ncbi:MAG: hypothetical protein ACOCRK_00920 [bacterium]